MRGAFIQNTFEKREEAIKEGLCEEDFDRIIGNPKE
jgi:hypothetical protein